MEVIIKTENVENFVSQHFIYKKRSPLICTGLITSADSDVKEQLNNIVIISKSSLLKKDDTLQIQVREWLNSRCTITHQYFYDIREYDSVSLKGVLIHYGIEPHYNH